MICYKDKTFCASDCQQVVCNRFFNKAESEKAVKWWGGENAPVAFSDFTKECSNYIPGNTDLPYMVASAIDSLNGK